MLGRRLVILVVVLMGLTALAASVAPPPEQQRRGAREATRSPSPSPTTTTARIPDEVSFTLDAAQRPRQLHAVVGDGVTLTVDAQVVDTVVIDGLDAVETVDPDSPAVFDLFADAAGSYPIRLLDSDRQIGELVISSDR